MSTVNEQRAMVNKQRIQVNHRSRFIDFFQLFVYQKVISIDYSMEGKSFPDIYPA